MKVINDKIDYKENCDVMIFIGFLFDERSIVWKIILVIFYLVILIIVEINVEMEVIFLYNYYYFVIYFSI